MRITLFGATTVCVDGNDIIVTAARQRAVLARLALTPGVAVSADQLLTDVWGDDLPSNGAKAVAFQINKLRGLLEPSRTGTGSVITTHAAGYRLEINGDDIDLHRFDRLVSDARARLDEPIEAGQLIDAALVLWGDRPFVDIDDQPWVNDELARLVQLHLLARRTRIHCLMARGHHADVIVELEQLIRGHPLEEGLVADQMTALHSVGRTADALRQYGDLRLRLSDELGIEPSADIVALERRLLDGLPTATTPDATSGSHELERGNLPVIPTQFVGRDTELERIGEALSASPLGVLTGPGGIGKTRLALEYARSAPASWPDGTWLVELAPVSDPSLVISVVAATFGLRSGEGASIGDVLHRYLRERKLLLVIDSCEHVRIATAAAISGILNAAPDVRVLATSRESLGLAGEQLVQVPPLAMFGSSATDEGATIGAAQEMLTDRARAVGVTTIDHDAVERICARVDGIPLGIELAAARLRTMSFVELADHIDLSLKALAVRSKQDTGRHRTLVATVEWSYSALTEDEQFALQRLSIFPAPFDLPAAEAVTGGLVVDRWQMLDMIGTLIDKSLVVTQPGVSGTRYRLLVPVREFAGERLEASGELDATRLRHAEHYAAFAEQASPQIRGAGYPEWAGRLFLELNHLRHAIDTFMACDRPEAVIQIGISLHVFFLHNGLHLEFIESMAAAVAATSETDPARIRGRWLASIMSTGITDPRAVDQARAGLAEARTTCDQNLIGRMELALGAAIHNLSLDPEYLEHLTEGCRLLEAHPEPRWWDPTWEEGLHHLIIATHLPASDDRVREHFERGLDALDQANDAVLHSALLSETVSLWGVADDGWVMDNTHRSVELLDQLDVPYWSGHSRITNGVFLMLRDRLDEAIANFDLASGELIGCGDMNCWATSLGLLASCRIELGQLDGAAAHLLVVVEQMDHLPATQRHQARILDRAATLIYRHGESEVAATLLGARLAVPNWETFIPWTADRIGLDSGLNELLGHKRTNKLIDAGRDLDFEAAARLFVPLLH